MLKANKYYLFSFQVNNKENNGMFEANARLEEGKVIFEFKMDDKTQIELMKLFEKRFKS